MSDGTTVVRNMIAQALIGESITPFNAANAYIGVGDSTDAFDVADTDLQAPTNKVRQGMESTYPSRSTNVLTYRSLFATGAANFAWNEWGIFNAASGGSMMCRKVESLGTKTSAQSWELTIEVTVTV